jgi:Domain of unknown function (DUF4249)
MKNILFLFLPLCLLATACENFLTQVVETDPPEYEKQLIFHLTLSDQDSAIRLTLTRNRGILEPINSNVDYFVKNATVTWWKDGQQLFQLAPLNADSAYIYIADLPARIKAGENYEIRATHPDFDEVSSVQVVPQSPNVLRATVEAGVGSDQFGSIVNELEIDIADPANQRDYYELQLSETFTSINCYTSGGQVYCDSFYFSNRVQFDQISDANIIEGPNGTLLLNDQFFDGITYLFRQRYAAYYDPESDSSVTRQLIVRKVTEDYYKWARSYRQSLDAQNNPLAEPVILYTNILNGLGIFGLFSEQRFEF